MTQPKLPKFLTLVPAEEPHDENRFSLSSDSPFKQRFRLVDELTARVWGFVVVDNTSHGPGLGGIRIAPDLTLDEVSRLARVMTLKNSAARIPFGGGKSGIVADPQFLSRNPTYKQELIALYAEAAFAIEDYIPAPDMGSDENDIQQIYEIYSEKLGTRLHQRGGSGRPVDKGGIPIDDWGLTAQGLYAAAKTLERLEPELPIEGSRVIIQGYGNVGSWTATKLKNAGAVIVGASDIHAALWNPDGLDVDQLNSIRHQPCGLQNYTGKTQRRFGRDQLDWLLEGPCEILVPAARPDAVTARNADRIQCRVILQGANTPVNKMTEYYLKNRRQIISLTDFIVNVGGVIGCAVELKTTADKAYRQKVLAKDPHQYLDNLIFKTVSKNIEEVFDLLEANPNKDTLFREEALHLAKDRLSSPTNEYWL